MINFNQILFLETTITSSLGCCQLRSELFNDMLHRFSFTFQYMVIIKELRNTTVCFLICKLSYQQSSFIVNTHIITEFIETQNMITKNLFAVHVLQSYADFGSYKV